MGIAAGVATKQRWWLMAAMAGLQLGDYASTQLVLQHPGGFEFNPLARLLGIGTAKLLALALSLIFVCRCRSKLLWVGLGFCSCVAAWNLVQLVLAHMLG